MEPLTIRLLGKPIISYEGQSLTFRTRKVLALLIFLVVEGGVHSRESLMSLLWPESTAESSAATLRSTLSRLRKSLHRAGDFLIIEGDSVGFDFDAPFDLDLAWLAEAARSEIPTNELAAILTLDRGEFLAGFSLPDTPSFDNWASIQGEACQRQLETVYDRLTQHQLATHDIGSAVESAARWVTRALYSEVAYRRLMAAQALAGDRHAALRSFEKVREMLKLEFEIEPARETVVLAGQIRDREFGVQKLDFGLPDQEPQIRDRSGAMPFVGRADEHSQLVAAFGQASEDGARVVTLIGSAGVGKTRLVEAFQEWVALDSPGVEIWHGRAFEMGGRLPYQAVVQAMRLRLEQENAPEDLLDDVWLAELSQLIPELRARYPDLPPPMTGDADFVRSRLFEALATLGSALVKNRPAVFILDDMQWADAETWDMIHYLARRWAEMSKPILLLVTVRQESFAANASLRDWLARMGRDVPLHRLLLDSLSGSAMKQLVARLAGSSAKAETTDAFGEWLWAETRGLPFFVEALLQMLVEQDVLKKGDEHTGEYDFAVALNRIQSITKVPVPPGVREVIQARLARHSTEARALLLAASVFGRACTYKHLCQVADLDEMQALEVVETLLNSRLLAERPGARRPYTLSHDYIREVVYSDSHDVRRRVFHRRALLALEADRAPAAECAFHALAAMLDEPAFRFSLAAGDEALASYALQDSLVHYDNARQVTQQMLERGMAVDSQSLRKLYQNRGRALELDDDYPAAQANYEEMRDIGTSQRDQAVVLAGLIAQCIIQANHTTVFNPSKARELGEAALDLARELKDRAAESAALQGMMLVENYGGGDDKKTLYYGQQSLSLARELGLKEQMGSVMLNLCWPYLAQMQLEEALKINSEALAIWRTMGNQQMSLEAHTMRLFLLSGAGELEELLATAQEALRLSRLTGSRVYEHIALQFMGRVLAPQGYFGPALANMEAALAMSEARETPYARQGDYESLIYFCLLTGAPEQADLWADKLSEAMESGSMPVWQTLFLTGIARAKIACGKVAEGQAILDKIIEGYEWETSRSYTLIQISIADAYLQMTLGKPEQAFGIREDQLQILRKAGFGNMLAEELLLRGKTLLAMDKVGKARQFLLKAQAVAEKQNERAILWQILATLSDLETKNGNKAVAEKLRGQTREIIEYIAEHAGTDEVRSVFLDQPAVSRILDRR